MTVPANTIATALTEALNTRFGSFTASRVYVPKFDTASSALQVQVFAKSDVREPETRKTDAAKIDVVIGVMQRLQNTVANEAAEIDALMETCEQVKAFVNRETIADAVCVEVKNDPLCSVDDADGRRTFLSLITATFTTSVIVT